MPTLIVEISFMSLYTYFVEYVMDVLIDNRCNDNANIAFVQHHFSWYIMNLYVINIVKIVQTMAYIIFKDGSMLALYVRIYVVDMF